MIKIGDFRELEFKITWRLLDIKKGTNKGNRPYLNGNVTNSLVDEIMSADIPVNDPFLDNGLRWDVQGTFNGTSGTWQLVIDLDTNMIVHFNFVK